MSRRTLLALAVLAAALFAACFAVVLLVRAALGLLDGPRPAASSERGEVLLLVSIDGFRSDYLGRHPAPTLERLAAEGVHARGLIPSYPSVTFPNHYTIVTGLRPEHHGIVGNAFYDPGLGAAFSAASRADEADARWWGGEPIWATAERQGLRAATATWPGAEAAIGGVRPSRVLPHDDATPEAARVDTVLAWLALPPDARPAFATLYFGSVDEAGHRYGPDAPETAAAVARVDRALGRLVAGLEARGLSERVNVLVVADHGMTAMRPERVVVLDDYADVAADVERVVGDEPLGIWPKPGRADALYAALRRAHIPHARVVRREETPAHLHYRASPRIAPILVMADEGWAVTTRARRAAGEGTLRGSHGFDPRLPSMHALLLARGPAFRRGAVVGPVENVHLYALMAHVLGVRPAPHDGDLGAVRSLLR